MDSLNIRKVSLVVAYLVRVIDFFVSIIIRDPVFELCIVFAVADLFLQSNGQWSSRIL